MIKFFEETQAKSIINSFTKGTLLSTYCDSPQEDVLFFVELDKTWAAIPSLSDSKELHIKLAEAEISLERDSAPSDQDAARVVKNLLLLKKDSFKDTSEHSLLKTDFSSLEEASLRDFRSLPFFGIILRSKIASYNKNTFEDTVKTFLSFFDLDITYGEDIYTAEDYQLKKYTSMGNTANISVQSLSLTYEDFYLKKTIPAELTIVAVLPTIAADSIFSVTNPSQQLKKSIKDILKQFTMS